MYAMILAAGRGERMRPLSDHTPKPLLPVAGKPLIVWHLERLARAGCRRVVINHAHLGAQIEQALGSGAQWDMHIRYSPEPPGALETAGGIAQALHAGLLPATAPFLLINGDIYCDWQLASAQHCPQADAVASGVSLAHLVLVANPAQHPQGDFALSDEPRLEQPPMFALRNDPAAGRMLTYSGIGIYHPHLFHGLAAQQPAKLAPLLRQAADAGQLSGEFHSGRWQDVGTPQRLAALNNALADQQTDST